MNQKKDRKRFFSATTLIALLVLGAPILFSIQELPVKPKIVLKSCDVSIAYLSAFPCSCSDANMQEALGRNDIKAIQKIRIDLVNNPGMPGASHSEATGKISVKFYDLGTCAEVVNVQSIALQPNEKRIIEIFNPNPAIPGYYFLKKSKGVSVEVLVDSPADSNKANNFKSVEL